MSSIPLSYKDKENEVYQANKTIKTPKQHNKALKKQFKTPPLKETTRIPLGGKQESKNQVPKANNDKIKDHARANFVSRLGRQTPVKRKVNILNEVASKQQQPQPLNSLLAKLNGINDFADSDLKLDEFLKHEKGDDIDIEIVPEKIEPLLDEPDDSISFKDINLAKIYKTPFHVPAFDENDKHLEQLLHVEFDDDNSFLSWDFENEDKNEESNSDGDNGAQTSITSRTPKTVLKSMKGMDISNQSGLKSGSKKRFMSSTTASSNKKSSTPMTNSKLVHELAVYGSTPKNSRNLLSELVKSDEDDDQESIFPESELKVEDEELKSLF